MQGYKILGLIHSTASDSAKLLHVSTDTEQKTQVDTEGPDVGSSLAGNPENAEILKRGEVSKLQFINNRRKRKKNLRGLWWLGCSPDV